MTNRFFTSKEPVYVFVKSCPEIGIDWMQDGYRNVFLMKTKDEYQAVSCFGERILTYLNHFTVDQICLLALLGYVTEHKI